MSIKQPETVL